MEILSNDLEGTSPLHKNNRDQSLVATLKQEQTGADLGILHWRSHYVEIKS